MKFILRLWDEYPALLVAICFTSFVGATLALASRHPAFHMGFGEWLACAALVPLYCIAWPDIRRLLGVKRG